MITKYIILFFIYAFIGWLLEVITMLISEKKFINRGFMMGPVVPIYAIGALLISLLLKKYESDLIILFIMSTIICSILEYLISFIMEKLFQLRWWDYSKRSFNLNGRICLGNAIAFGFLGTLVIKVLNPFFFMLIDCFIPNTAPIIAFVLGSLFIIDFLVSFNVTYNLKNITKNVNKDSTEEISKQVKKEVKSNKYLYNRIINAFPNMKKIIKKEKLKIEKQKKKIAKEKDKLKSLKRRNK